MSSLLSIGLGNFTGSQKTPKTGRRASHNHSEEKTVTIKCTRMNADSKEFEEVDVEVNKE